MPWSKVPGFGLKCCTYREAVRHPSASRPQRRAPIGRLSAEMLDDSRRLIFLNANNDLVSTKARRCHLGFVPTLEVELEQPHAHLVYGGARVSDVAKLPSISSLPTNHSLECGSRSESGIRTAAPDRLSQQPLIFVGSTLATHTP